MLQQFIKDWKLHKSSFFTMLAAQIGFFLLGILLVIMVMNFDDDPGSWFCMGTMVACIVLVVICGFFYGFSYSQEFQLALSMGCTRMAFLGAFTLRLLLQILSGYVLILGMHQIELSLYPRLFPQYPNEILFTFLTDWRIIVPVMVGMTILSLFIGSLYGRYGKKGTIFFYVLWIFCCFILPRIFHAEPGTGVLDQTAWGIRTVVLAVPVTVWIVFGIVLAVGMVITIIRFAKVQMVR